MITILCNEDMGMPVYSSANIFPAVDQNKLVGALSNGLMKSESDIEIQFH